MRAGKSKARRKELSGFGKTGKAACFAFAREIKRTSTLALLHAHAHGLLENARSPKLTTAKHSAQGHTPSTYVHLLRAQPLLRPLPLSTALPTPRQLNHPLSIPSKNLAFIVRISALKRRSVDTFPPREKRAAFNLSTCFSMRFRAPLSVCAFNVRKRGCRS